MKAIEHLVHGKAVEPYQEEQVMGGALLNKPCAQRKIMIVTDRPIRLGEPLLPKPELLFAASHQERKLYVQLEEGYVLLGERVLPDALQGTVHIEKYIIQILA